jgi:hypothetical protein
MLCYPTVNYQVAGCPWRNIANACVDRDDSLSHRNISMRPEAEKSANEIRDGRIKDDVRLTFLTFQGHTAAVRTEVIVRPISQCSTLGKD